MRLGGYVASGLRGEDDRRDWMALRRRLFRGDRAGDEDQYDETARVVLIRRAGRGAEAVGGFRLTLFPDGGAAGAGYSAQFYDLGPLARIRRPVAELGRLCLVPGADGPDLFRLVLAALARFTGEHRLALLFGAASFAGADAARHAPALAWLTAHAHGPEGLRPLARAAAPVPVAAPDPGGLPAVLRFYLNAGAWVGTGAVADPALDTLHVFTALEPDRVPPARARALRALAAALQAT